MKLLCRQSKDSRKFIVDYLQDPSRRVDNMVDGWFWHAYLWNFIVGLMKLRKFHPSLHQNIHTSNGRYKLIILRICKMAEGVFTLSLEQAMRKLFFGTQALPKNRGHVLTPDFGMVKNLFKLASNR